MRRAGKPCQALRQLPECLRLEHYERRDPAQGTTLCAWLNGNVIPAFDGRILDVDTAIALRSARLNMPEPRPVRDGLIAATALVHGMTVVTRNVAGFAPTGVAVLNPWSGP